MARWHAPARPRSTQKRVSRPSAVWPGSETPASCLTVGVATVPIADATPRSLASLMVGRELGDGAAPVERSAGEPVLEVDDVWTQGDRGGDAVRGVSLTVRAGEIVAVAGVAGNGQRELAETIAGLRAPSRGRVRVGGKVLRQGDPRSAIAAGIAYVPEDRMGTGVAPSLSIAANLVLKSYRQGHVSRGPLLRLRHIRDRAVNALCTFAQDEP